MADISYNPTTWVDNQTPVDQSAMNNIEQGIVNATTQINTNTTNIAKNTSDIADLHAGGGGTDVTDVTNYAGFLTGRTSSLAFPFGYGSKYTIDGNIEDLQVAGSWVASGSSYTLRLFHEITPPSTAEEGYFMGDVVSGITIPNKSSSGSCKIQLVLTVDGEVYSFGIRNNNSSTSLTNMTIGIVQPVYFNINPTDKSCCISYLSGYGGYFSNEIITTYAADDSFGLKYWVDSNQKNASFNNSSIVTSNSSMNILCMNSPITFKTSIEAHLECSGYGSIPSGEVTNHYFIGYKKKQ